MVRRRQVVRGEGKGRPRRIAWAPTVCPYLCFSTRFSGSPSVSSSCLDSGLSVLPLDLHRPVGHRTPGGWASVGSSTTSPRAWNWCFCASHHHVWSLSHLDYFRSLVAPPSTKILRVLSTYPMCWKTPGIAPPSGACTPECFPPLPDSHRALRWLFMSLAIFSYLKLLLPWFSHLPLSTGWSSLARGLIHCLFSCSGESRCFLFCFVF